MGFETRTHMRQPVLDAPTRQWVFALMSLEKLSYRLTETVENLVLRERDVVDGKIVHRVGNSPSIDFPVLRIDYAPRRLLTQERERSLWNALFPRPFSTLEAFFVPKDGARTNAEPASFLAQLENLHQTLAQLQEKLCHTELSCLYLTDQDMSLPLLLHFSKHRLMGAEAATSLTEWDGQVREDKLSRETLQNVFGTPTSFARLDLSTREGDGLTSLLTALKHTLTAETRLKVGLSPEGVSSGYELGL